jgi:translation elongation factor aEF-1 beta
MGKVLCILRVMPKGIEIKINELKTKIADLINPEAMEEIPVAFGLKAIKVSKIVDNEAELDKIEKDLNAIHEIESVTTEGVTLI